MKKSVAILLFLALFPGRAVFGGDLKVDGGLFLWDGPGDSSTVLTFIRDGGNEVTFYNPHLFTVIGLKALNCVVVIDRSRRRVDEVFVIKVFPSGVRYLEIVSKFHGVKTYEYLTAQVDDSKAVTFVYKKEDGTSAKDKIDFIKIINKFDELKGKKLTLQGSYLTIHVNGEDELH